MLKTVTLTCGQYNIEKTPHSTSAYLSGTSWFMKLHLGQWFASKEAARDGLKTREHHGIIVARTPACITHAENLHRICSRAPATTVAMEVWVTLRSIVLFDYVWIGGGVVWS